MLALRVIRINGRWDDYWTYEISRRMIAA